MRASRHTFSEIPSASFWRQLWLQSCDTCIFGYRHRGLAYISNQLSKTFQVQEVMFAEPSSEAKLAEQSQQSEQEMWIYKVGNLDSLQIFLRDREQSENSLSMLRYVTHVKCRRFMHADALRSFFFWYFSWIYST